tara:strand:- start:34510 stop:34989 length:480 start_codon:yes stop_codon:yes gene_type:complete
MKNPATGGVFYLRYTLIEQHKECVMKRICCLFLLSVSSLAYANTAVNSQITDSVTQANVKVLGDSPAVAIGNLYQVSGSKCQIKFNDITIALQENPINTDAPAQTTAGVVTLYTQDIQGTVSQATLCQPGEYDILLKKHYHELTLLSQLREYRNQCCNQ